MAVKYSISKWNILSLNKEAKHITEPAWSPKAM